MPTRKRRLQSNSNLPVIDSMTRTERVAAAVQGEDLDRVPVCFWHHFQPEGSGRAIVDIGQLSPYRGRGYWNLPSWVRQMSGGSDKDVHRVVGHGCMTVQRPVCAGISREDFPQRLLKPQVSHMRRLRMTDSRT